MGRDVLSVINAVAAQKIMLQAFFEGIGSCPVLGFKRIPFLSSGSFSTRLRSRYDYGKNVASFAVKEGPSSLHNL